MRSTGNASQTNSFSYSTASWIMACTSSSDSFFSNMEYNRHAKSQCLRIKERRRGSGMRGKPKWFYRAGWNGGSDNALANSKGAKQLSAQDP